MKNVLIIKKRLDYMDSNADVLKNVLELARSTNEPTIIQSALHDKLVKTWRNIFDFKEKYSKELNV